MFFVQFLMLFSYVTPTLFEKKYCCYRCPLSLSPRWKGMAVAKMYFIAQLPGRQNGLETVKELLPDVPDLSALRRPMLGLLAIIWTTNSPNCALLYLSQCFYRWQMMSRSSAPNFLPFRWISKCLSYFMYEYNVYMNL